MECYLEKSGPSSNFNLANAGLTALYHSQCLLPAQRVDLSGNMLARSLPRLSSLQFCQVSQNATGTYVYLGVHTLHKTIMKTRGGSVPVFGQLLVL